MRKRPARASPALERALQKGDVLQAGTEKWKPLPAFHAGRKEKRLGYRRA